MTSEEKFLSKVEKQENGCWLWKGYLFPEGYGGIKLNGKSEKAHRWAYKLFKGFIPEKLVIDHLCRNKQCVNPDHLECVTSKINSIRGNAGSNNSVKTHCPKGHPYNEVNTYVYTTKSGGLGRICRLCNNRGHVKAYQKKRGLSSF